MMTARASALGPCAAGVLAAAAAAVPLRAADPWADRVVEYAPGSSPAPGYADPGAALGEPTRFTGERLGFPGAVTPFNPAFDDDEIVSLGRGGRLTLRFDEPVLDDPANPWGLDLIVFGNCGYTDAAYPRGLAGPLFGGGEATLELSADGQRWVEAPGLAIDGPFPTLGYADLPGPYALDPGRVLTDFTRPVRPGFDARGLDFAAIVRAYRGSGGGTGVDIGALGLGSVSFVRVLVGSGASVTTEIDALADVSPVPAPGAAVMLAAAAAGGRRRRGKGAA